MTIDGHGADELFSGYGHLLEGLWDSKLDINRTIDILDTHLDTVLTNKQIKKKNKVKIIEEWRLKKLLNLCLEKN